MAVETVFETLVETALTFSPWLTDIPVLGRILTNFAPGGGNDLKALEQLQAAQIKKKSEVEARIKKNARYVLKASEAMKCVDSSLGNGAILLALGKAILNTVAGRPGGTAPDLLESKIFACIESKVLSQKSKRVKREGSFYHRPSKGHGEGRGKF